MINVTTDVGYTSYKNPRYKTTHSAFCCSRPFASGVVQSADVWIYGIESIQGSKACTCRWARYMYMNMNVYTGMNAQYLPRPS